jgi:cephalosporin-C deacetylase-like acetyl esterase
MAFGLQDPTCPPHTNFAIYNNLGSAEKHYFCVPTCGHAMWLEPDWPPVRDAFLFGD